MKIDEILPNQMVPAQTNPNFIQYNQILQHAQNLCCKLSLSFIYII